MKWEYKVEDFQYKIKLNEFNIENNDEILEGIINERGLKGWELTSTIPSYEAENKEKIKAINLIFKRPIK